MGHVGPITDLSFSRNGLRLLSASEDHSARLWRLGETADLDAKGLRSRFCSETDPWLRHLDGSRGGDIGLSYKVDHDPAAVRALMKEIKSLDACAASGS